MEGGEVWAYRARARDPVTRVEIQKLGSSKPPRVRVRFLEEEFEGREDWVSPARLKVPWDRVDGWLARERRWEAAREVSWQIHDEPEGRAADLVFDQVIDEDVAYAGYNAPARGLLVVNDLAALCAQLQLDERELRSDPSAFTDDDGTFVAPAAVLLKVAQQAARLNADVLLSYLDRREHEARLEAIHGTYYPSRGRGDGRHISPETCAEVDAEHAPARALVRQWCGAEARDRFDELKALRAEVLRLGRLVESAITELRAAGAKAAADRLERELGVPIETIRQGMKRDYERSGP